MIHLFNPSAELALKWSWVTLCGRDARDFLQRLTTVQVNGLEIGQGSPGFFLNPQGKIRAYFTLWRYGLDEYAFEFDAGASGHWKTELLEAIDQYTFAEKITVTDVTGLESRWLLADTEKEAAGMIVAPEDIQIRRQGLSQFGSPWWTAWGKPARLEQWIPSAFPAASPMSWSELERRRVLSLRPRMDAEITSATIPLEVGLTEGLAQAKGCYPGQEVIERITALGAPARRLARIDGGGSAPAAGDTVFNLAQPPIEVGQLTSVTSNEAGFVALGFIRKIHAKEGLEVRLGSSTGSIVRVAPFS